MKTGDLPLGNAFIKLFVVVNLTLGLIGASRADELTPASNLAGIKIVQEKIDVSLNLKGANEFGVDANETVRIIRAALASSGITMIKGDYNTPIVHVSIDGESSGGGGAQFTVEVVVRTLLPSPFLKERTIEAIIWRGTAAGHQLLRFDPAAKELVKPTRSINESVYDTVREVAAHLASEIKGA
jgi:hypothetical protein